MIHIISKMKQDEDYTSLTLEEQDNMFFELMRINKKVR